MKNGMMVVGNIAAWAVMLGLCLVITANAAHGSIVWIAGWIGTLLSAVMAMVKVAPLEAMLEQKISQEETRAEAYIDA